MSTDWEKSPSLRELLAYDALISAACGIAFAVALAPYSEAEFLHLAWYWQLAGALVGFTAMSLGCWLVVAIFKDTALVANIVRAYERAASYREFRAMEYKDLNNRESLVFYLVPLSRFWRPCFPRSSGQ